MVSKNLRKYLIILLGILAINLFNNSNSLATNNKLTKNDFLTTKGTKIVNQNGEEIVLKGYNVGLWLSRSFWGLPIDATLIQTMVLDIRL